MSACIADDLLAAFVSGEASPEELRVIEEHLAECSTCSGLCRGASAVEPRGPAARLDPDELRWALPEIPRGTSVGRFLVLEQLGRGGMGIVYSAYDPQLDRRVALKFLAHEIEPARLFREARAIARLAHPNVVGVHEVGEHAGAPYVAMELITGETLDRYLARGGEAWTAILAIFLQAGAGLAAAHASAVVHRDFKPSNVLVGADGRVRVSDFGLARLDDHPQEPVGDLTTYTAERTTLAGAMVGTPAYMAPEQRAGGAVDARADQYSFAVALHEALFARRPSGTALPAMSAPPAVPEAVRTALVRALSADPAARYPSMSELLDVLREHDPSDPRNVGEAALAEAGRLTQRWKRLVWGALVVSLVTVATAAVITMVVARRERDAAQRSAQLARDAEQLATQRLDNEQRQNARVAYERGDVVGSLRYVSQLLERGVDDPLLRHIVGTVSWAWSHETQAHRDVHSVVVTAGGERTLLQLDGSLVVLDGAGGVLVRVPLQPDDRGSDLDERGENLVILDPDLRVIPVAHPERARVIARAPSDQRWVVPKFIGDQFAVRSDDDILLIDGTGTVVQRLPAKAARPTRLALSRRIVLADEGGTRVISLTGQRSRRAVGSFAVAERPRDLALALAEAGRVTIVDTELRPIRSIEIGGDAHRVQFSRDGSILAVAVDDDVLLYDVTSGTRRARIASHRETPFAFDDDGVWTGADGVLRRWSFEGALQATIVAPGRSVETLWLTDSHLAVFAATSVQFYALPLSRTVAMPGDCRARRSETATTGSTFVACADGTLRRWSASGAEILTRDVDTPEWVFVDPAGVFVAVLRYAEVDVFANGTRVSSPLEIQSVRQIAPTPGGLLVATVDGLRRLSLPSLTWSEIPSAGLVVTSMVWLGGTRDDVLAVLDNQVLVEIGTTVSEPRRLPLQVIDLASSGDGTMLAVRSADDVISVLDRFTLRPRHPVPIAVGQVKAFALDRTGEQLVVTTVDNRVLLVDTRDGAAVEIPVGRVQASDVAIDGETLFLTLDGKPIRVTLPRDTRPRAELAKEVACRYGSGTPCSH